MCFGFQLYSNLANEGADLRTGFSMLRFDLSKEVLVYAKSLDRGGGDGDWFNFNAASCIWSLSISINVAIGHRAFSCVVVL